MNWLNEDELISYTNLKKPKLDTPPQKSQLVVCGPPSLQEEENELGVPGPRSHCYGCKYINEELTVEAPVELIQQFNSLVRKHIIAKTNFISAALQLAEKHRVMRDEVNRFAKLGQHEIPEWSAASILDCLRNHNFNPLIKLWFRLAQVNDLINISYRASVVQDSITKEMQLDPKQTKQFVELVKLEEQLYKSGDPSKKAFGTGKDQAKMDLDPVRTSGKPWVALLKSSTNKK